MKTITLLLALLLLCGCGMTKTVVPIPVEATQASFDGNEQNSGIIGIHPSGGYEVSARFFSRYQELVDMYGESYHPRLQPNSGIRVIHLLSDPPKEVIIIDKEHMIKFIEMNTWRKTGRKPD
jgi:hypothetical protein